MNKLYERIAALCAERGIRPGRMSNDLGISRGNISDLKMGRIESLSAEKLSKISAYFGVSVDYLLNGTETKKAPTNGERKISDHDIMFALWGDTNEMDKDDLDDVKRYATFIRERKKEK